MDAAPQRPAVVWGRRHESTPTESLEAPIAATPMSATFETIEPKDAASVEQTTRAETTALPTTRRTRTSARAGVSASEASQTAAPEVSAPAMPASAAEPASRAAARRARTSAVEVAPITRARMVPAAAPILPAPEPVMELRQVITTAPIALPEPAALPASPSIAAVPLVDAPKRTRIRPTVSEPVASTAPAAAAPVVESTAAPEFTAPAEPTVTTAPPVAEEAWEPQAEAHGAWRSESDVDEFEAAARLFCFTGETPVQRSATAPQPAAEPVTHAAPRRTGKSGMRRVAAASVSVGVMGLVGMLTVGMTTPAEAVAAATGNDNVKAVLMSPAGSAGGGDVEDIHAYVASADAQNPALGDRATSYGTLSAVQAGAYSGVTNVSNEWFTNNPNSPVQWPFAVGCTISWGFGWRPGEFHKGVDFTPGAGAHVQAIADGVVRLSTDSGGGYGVEIIIDHVINGQKVSSRYGHMQYGSRQVQTGDHVKVGQYIGRTGNTGMSYGAHTHLEILIGGTTPIDPLPWLRSHVLPL